MTDTIWCADIPCLIMLLALFSAMIIGALR